MSLFSAVLLGFVQGLTEFLPISSSGHLSIFQTVFGLANPEEVIVFDILLHLGTLVAVFAVYYQDILQLISAFLAMVWDVVRGKGAKLREYPYRKFCVLIILTTLPLFAAVFVKDYVESLFSNMIFVGCALLITGILLGYTDMLKPGSKRLKTANEKNALVVGLFQLAAVLPGISRSGSTITGGLLSGFSREFAVKYSFIAAIPAIIGANILTIGEITKNPIAPAEFLIYLAGMAVAAVSGFFAIKAINYLVKKGNFKIFSRYCLIVGVLVLAYGILT